MQKLRRALVRGRRAEYWFHLNGCLVLRHPGGRNQDEIPTDHLRNAVQMDEHYARLEGKDWVPRGAILELRQIADGAVA